MVPIMWHREPTSSGRMYTAQTESEIKRGWVNSFVHIRTEITTEMGGVRGYPIRNSSGHKSGWSV